MSQYSSRINIKVSSIEIWKKMKDINFENYGIDNEIKNLFEEYGDNNFIIDGDWSISEEKMVELVTEIVTTLGRLETIIIADTTNMNVDTYNFCVYFIDDMMVKTKYFGENSKKSEMFYSTNISNIQEWLEYGGFRLSKKEYEKLLRFGITLKEKRVEKSSKIKKESINKSEHKNKYISKINILFPSSKDFLRLKKNFFKVNNFQFCTEIEDAKTFFKDYKQKSFVVENWDINPKDIDWFCIQNFSYDSIILIETRKNKPNSPITYYCAFPYPNKSTVVTLKEPIKADIRNVEKWMKEIKVRMTPKKKQILDNCIE